MIPTIVRVKFLAHSNQVGIRQVRVESKATERENTIMISNVSVSNELKKLEYDDHYSFFILITQL